MLHFLVIVLILYVSDCERIGYSVGSPSDVSSKNGCWLSFYD